MINTHPKLLLLFVFTFFTQMLYAQNLEDEIRKLTQDFKGEIGIYVENLTTGEAVEVNANTIFPTASIVKIPILLGVFDKIENNQLSYRAPLVYHDSIKYGGAGLMQFYKDSTNTDLSVLLALMLSYSDNTTSLWNQSLAGGGAQINLLMEQFGYKDTRVNSRTPGRTEDWEKYGWGQTTPKEIADILGKIYQRQLISPSASEQMYRLLSNTYYSDYAVSQIPPGVNVASKQGMVNASRSEVFLVNSPTGDYVCAILTNNNEDQRWTFDNEAWVLTRQLSNLIWNYFNPERKYTPAPGSIRYLEGLQY